MSEGADVPHGTEFELQFPNKSPIKLRLVSAVDSLSPVIEFEARQPRFKSNRYDVEEGAQGVLVDAGATRLKTNHTHAEIDAAGYEDDHDLVARVFMTSRRRPSMRVRVISASFPSRDVQRNIYGRSEPLFHPSRNRGRVQVEFVGDEFDQWLGFLSALKHRAISHSAFVSFAKSAFEKGIDVHESEMVEGEDVDSDDDSVASERSSGRIHRRSVGRWKRARR